MAENAPLAVSFVSGKGGVGKTMLAVAFAHEISRNARTLVLDLDFFNRGLTGLMRQGTNGQPVAQPDFLEAASPAQPATDPWEVVQVAPNLLHLRFPDLLPDQVQSLEEANISELAESLGRYLDYLRRVSQCEIIVMDCHGGPDQVSFAACLVSDYSLLISEPDKITFYGTLHFVRQLERAIPETARRPDLRLVFNKVVPAFSVPYLEKLYDAEIRKYFGDHSLLGVFPLEIYLTKEFERTTFLTAVYPFSQLAKKTQVLIYDLLADKLPRLASASTPIRSRWRLWVTRHSLGRTPRIIDLSYVMAIIAGGFLVLTVINLYGSKVKDDYPDMRKAVHELELYDYVNKNLEAVRKRCDPRYDSNGLKYPDTEDFYHVANCLGHDTPPFDGTMEHSLFASARLLGRTDLRSSRYGDIQAAYASLKPVPWHHRILLTVYYYLFGYSDWRNYDSLEGKSTFLGATALSWFFAALMLNWGILLDRTFTCNSRVHHWSVATICFLAALAIWSIPATDIGGFVRFHYVRIDIRDGRNIYGWRIESLKELIRPVAGVIVVAVAVIAQSFKAHRNVGFEERVAEASVRLLFLVCLIALLLLALLVGIRFV